MSRAVPAFVVCSLVLLGAGCRTHDLAFRADERVTIDSPEQRSTVQLPFTLRWTARDFRGIGADGSQKKDRGFYAVFLDRSPIPPGETLAYVSRDDPACHDPCADPSYLAQKGIRVTKDSFLRIDTLQDNRPVDRPSAKDNHEIRIVLMNGVGERIGEAAFKVGFTLDRGEN